MLARIITAARRHGLGLVGGFHPEDGDQTPAHAGTMLLLGPDGPDFWPIFSASPEALDAAPDPLDRWSRRVLGQLALQFDATSLFPFDGPPYYPFFLWALRTGRVHASPVSLLVSGTSGLFVSFRGALALDARIEIPQPDQTPCASCAGQPCLTACPPQAMLRARYDVPACHAWLDTEPGEDCLSRGCAVRRACPVGQSLRPEPQSAFHMARFHERAS